MRNLSPISGTSDLLLQFTQFIYWANRVKCGFRRRWYIALFFVSSSLSSSVSLVSFVVSQSFMSSPDEVESFEITDRDFANEFNRPMRRQSKKQAMLGWLVRVR